MFARHNNSFVLVALLLVTACYFAYPVSADNPSAGKTKKAVEAADAATKKAKAAADAAAAAGLADAMGTHYPDTADGKAAKDADKAADTADAAAADAEKAAADARDKACKSGKADDKKAADDADKAAQNAEANADAADAAADAADRKADPFAHLQKEARDAARAARAAKKAARAAICFALQCAQLMDESSPQNKKKKDETIQTIEGLNASVDKLLALAPQGGNGKVETAQGLCRVTFDTLPGRVIVNLPDDMRAGDTISGTVFEEPKGQSEDERNRNEKTLNGLVVNFAGERVPVSAKTFKLSIPTAVAGNPKPSDFRIIIEPRAPQDPPVRFFQGPQDDPFFFDIPAELFYRPAPQPPQQVAIPSLGQTGRPIVITGPFDGDSSNTKIDFQASGPNVTPIGGDLNGMVPIAESPRKVIVQSPSDVTGPMEIRVKEGMTETKGTFRNLGVKLSAPKTSLLRGERTTLTIEVNGLQGITKPVPLTLESNGVITMEGGMYQPLGIQPSQVGVDGRYTTTRGITGVQAGGWSATATVVTQPFNIVLRDPDPPRTLLINSFTGDYVLCGSDFKLRGIGQIRQAGNIVTLTDNQPDRQVQGRFDTSIRPTLIIFTLRSPGAPTNIEITTSNSQPPKTRVYFNPLGRPAPPVQDVSAFATCP